VQTKKTRFLTHLTVTLLSTTLLAHFANAQNPGNTTDAKNDSRKAKQINVDSIKEKYWAKGEQTELGVVQNRKYSKGDKIQFGLLGSLVISDPFLSTRLLGASIGYHFSEYFSVSLLAWKNFVSPSAALKTFEASSSGATANTNKPESYFGGEAVGSLLYGKLSLLGAAIIYYDLHLLGGLGMTSTESGNNITPHVGVGQRFFISKHFSLRLDFRLMYYRETILEKVIPTKLGQVQGKRNNFTNTINLGIDFLGDIF